jgi:cytochrome c oxidase cbb3-type subunit III
MRFAADAKAQQTQPTKAASTAPRDAGKKTFATACSGCHGLDGRGGKHAPNIATRAEVARLSDAQISRIIREGTPSLTMPGFGAALDDSQILAVTAYLRTLQGQQNSAPLPGDPKNGKTLFFGRAACAECHMANGEGGFIAGDLSAYAASRSAEEVRQAVVDPNGDVSANARTAVVLARNGETFTGLVRNEDNFSLQLQTLDGAFHLLARSDLQSVDFRAKSLMPADYAQKLTAREVNDLVSFLMRAASAPSIPQPAPIGPKPTKR